MQVRLLPGAGPIVAGEAALGGAEFRAVHGAAALPVDAGREDLVEHLVEDDHVDEVAGHALVIERGMDADDFLVVEVDAHLDGAAPAILGAPAPADAGADLVV